MPVKTKPKNKIGVEHDKQCQCVICKELRNFPVPWKKGNVLGGRKSSVKDNFILKPRSDWAER